MSKIHEDILNSKIEYCIDEYVRLKVHRQMLREKWFEGYSLKELADKYKLSDTAIKNVIYGEGDRILCKAYEMSLKVSKN